MKNRMERSIVLVAEFEGKLQGFANYFPSKEYTDEAELGAIYILPELQSQGIGSKLISAGIEELGGIKRLYVVVEKENIIGNRFYTSKGFVNVNEYEENLQGHILKMVKMVLNIMN